MNFVAFPRELQGTGASRRLRIAGKVPAIVYGASATPVQIELDHNAMFHALKKEAFHTSVLEMELAGQTSKVVLRALQMHPFKPLVLHADFQRVDATTRLRKKVALQFVNEAESPAVKLEKCTIERAVTELQIECLAEQVPEFLTVDLGGLSTGKTLHVNDLTLPNGVKVLTRGFKNPLIATAVPIVEEVIVVAAAPAPVKGKKAKK
ncbi:MAG: 50S ribosomal protein L25/general stress protein Ctc [Sphaerotilus sp.]|nr:50S ribosomal protein L25/general stress protein Ctc [Sphaerotilus sp.]